MLAFVLYTISMEVFEINKKGFVSVDTAISMSVVLIVLMIGIGFYAYMYPQISFSNEVYALSRVANEQGGLTLDNITAFKERINETTYVQESSGDISVELVDEDKNSYTSVTPMGDSGSNYLKREDLIMCELIVKIPANITMLETVLFAVDVEDIVGNYYIYRYPVMSKRN